MSSLALGAGLALVASLALNAGFLAQHAGSRHAAAVSPRHPVRSVRALVASPVWSVGMLMGLIGWALHVGALAHAPLSLVQPFAAGGMALTIPAAARLLGERLTTRERGAVALTVIALVGLSLGTSSRAPSDHFSALGLLGFAGSAAAVAMLGFMFATGPALLGGVAGVFYGAADAVTKGVTQTARHSLAAGLTSPWVALVVGLSVGAFFSFQRGLQLGSAVPTIALMTTLTNVVSVVAGLTVFGEPLGSSVALAIGHGLALAAAALAVWLLASAQGRLAEQQKSFGIARGDLALGQG